jgi:hypothetical protein
VKKISSILLLVSILTLSTLLATPMLAAVRATSNNASSATGFGLDCNGYAKYGLNIEDRLICGDPLHTLESNYGQYIGHDEPSLQFFSSVAGSGNNLQYSMTLPATDPQPKTDGSQTANFENYVAFWFSMAICDPNSYPFGACSANTDGQAATAGSALLELQLYPPGWEPFISQISCNHTQWCAALNIDSLTLNNACFEPVNFAYLQTDGVPAGPPGPGSQTSGTFTPNSKTLFMNPGDQIAVTVQDTASGFKTTIADTTTSQSGFMVASGANGFANTSPADCSTTAFNFHPEYSTAKAGNIVPWTALFANINFAMEIGHYQLGPSGDNDADDAPCFAGPNNTFSASSVGGCTGKNTDFDGTSYLADWADGTAAHPSSFAFASPLSFTGSLYNSPFPTMLFATDAPASESSCNTSTGVGCTIPPTNLETAKPTQLYPFYSINAACSWLFGNDIAGQTTNDFGKDAQYGSVNPLFGGTFTSSPHDTPVCAVPPTLTTQLSSTTISAGSSVTDQATLANFNSPTGTVSFFFSTTNSCPSANAIQVGTPVTVSGNGVYSSASQTFSTAGTYYWYAVYSGDSNNKGMTSACEPLTVLTTTTAPEFPFPFLIISAVAFLGLAVLLRARRITPSSRGI